MENGSYESPVYFFFDLFFLSVCVGSCNSVLVREGQEHFSPGCSGMGLCLLLILLEESCIPNRHNRETITDELVVSQEELTLIAEPQLQFAAILMPHQRIMKAFLATTSNHLIAEKSGAWQRMPKKPTRS